LDVSDGDATARAIREIDDECDGLDLIVANAGVGVDRTRSPYEWEAVREALTTNFVGAGATLTAVLPRMMERRRGHLVGISSLASYGAVPGGVAYSAPKAGLSMMLDCLRLDTHGCGIAVTEVKLGFVDTASIEGATHPLPQLQSAEHVAKVIVKRLSTRPDSIVYPRTLGVVAQAGAKLPQWSRRMLFKLGQGS
jgi:NAD(P)-dependent dehydrogenase (short-subunit alcohol dehydrogenase family)